MQIMREESEGQMQGLQNPFPQFPLKNIHSHRFGMSHADLMEPTVKNKMN